MLRSIRDDEVVGEIDGVGGVGGLEITEES
jgi:hypothetical protein